MKKYKVKKEPLLETIYRSKQILNEPTKHDLKQV